MLGIIATATIRGRTFCFHMAIGRCWHWRRNWRRRNRRQRLHRHSPNTLWNLWWCFGGRSHNPSGWRRSSRCSRCRWTSQWSWLNWCRWRRQKSSHSWQSSSRRLHGKPLPDHVWQPLVVGNVCRFGSRNSFRAPSTADFGLNLIQPCLFKALGFSKGAHKLFSKKKLLFQGRERSLDIRTDAEDLLMDFPQSCVELSIVINSKTAYLHIRLLAGHQPQYTAQAMDSQVACQGRVKALIHSLQSFRKPLLQGRKHRQARL